MGPTLACLTPLQAGDSGTRQSPRGPFLLQSQVGLVTVLFCDLEWDPLSAAEYKHSLTIWGQLEDVSRDLEFSVLYPDPSHMVCPWDSHHPSLYSGWIMGDLTDSGIHR